MTQHCKVVISVKLPMNFVPEIVGKSNEHDGWLHYAWL